MISLFFVAEPHVLKVTVGNSFSGMSGDVALVPSSWEELCRERNVPVIDLDRYREIEYSLPPAFCTYNGWLGSFDGGIKKSDFFPVLRQPLGEEKDLPDRRKIVEVVIKSINASGPGLVEQALRFAESLDPSPDARRRFGALPLRIVSL
jgi:hypothetical protein